MNKLGWILIFLLMPATGGLAQPQIDSLQQALKKSQNLSSKSLIINQIAYAYRETNPNEARKHAHEAEEIALKNNLTKELGKIYENLGWIYYRMGDAHIALEYNLKALKFNELYQNKTELLHTYNNLAAIYVDQAKFDLGLENLFKALELANQLNSIRGKSRTLNNLAYNYLTQKKLDSALYYAQICLRFSQNVNYQESVAFAMRNLGDIYLLKKQNPKARNYYQQGLVISQKTQYNFLIATLTTCIGETYIPENPTTALRYLQEAVILAKKYGYQEELPFIYQKISEVALLQKDFALAYRYSQMYAEIKDTLANFERIKQMEYLNYQAENIKKQSKIDLLAKDSLIQTAQIKAQQRLIWIVVIILILIVLLLGLTMYINRLRQRNNLILQHQKNELEQKNAEISLQKEEIKSQAEHLQALNDLKNKLFSIISHDLRTPIGSMKNVIYLLENRFLNQEEFFSMAGELKKNVDSTFYTLDNLLQWVLTQMEGVSVKPTSLNIYTMVQNKLDLYAEYIQSKKIRVHNQITADAYFWADFQHIDLVLRNLIGNALKFTPRGGQIEISYVVRPNAGEVWIKDSGVGISDDDLTKLFQVKQNISRYGTDNEKGTGIGLLLCKEFIERNQGKIWAESKLNEGSTFKFCLPTQTSKI
ncbi:MAG: tetratricopeptide repeat-containing sensor histidine kinase [Microscillaceae bacterium]|jgi:signal transduction histidine kinase|nr:tetratricopeptide repeat-containing sensor histidine kinase [Microscillaceae bacterium]